MHPRHHILVAATLLAVSALGAGHVLACPHHDSRSAAALEAAGSAVRSTPVHARAAALVAWKPRAWQPALPVPAQGLRVSIDPIDGAMGMPPADELAQQVVVADDTPAQIDRAADGTLTAHLDDRWADFAVATVGADGKPAWTCVPGRSAAVRFLRQPRLEILPVAPKPEDR